MGQGLQGVYGERGFRYVYAGYIGGHPLTCAEVHDMADSNGWLGRVTLLDDTGFVVYRTLMNSRAGVPQFLVLDREMHVRGYRDDWDPSSDPAWFQGLIETLLAE